MGLAHNAYKYWQRLLLVIAAACSIALPNVVLARQAADGELLRIVCTAEGKKAIGGAHSSHDCVQCCAGGALPSAQPAVHAVPATACAQRTLGAPEVLLSPAYLAAAPRGPPTTPRV